MPGDDERVLRLSHPESAAGQQEARRQYLEGADVQAVPVHGPGSYVAAASSATIVLTQAHVLHIPDGMQPSMRSPGGPIAREVRHCAAFTAHLQDGIIQ